MTELFSREIRTQNRHSSKGNQLKFERDHIWYLFNDDTATE